MKFLSKAPALPSDALFSDSTSHSTSHFVHLPGFAFGVLVPCGQLRPHPVHLVHRQGKGRQIHDSRFDVTSSIFRTLSGLPVALAGRKYGAFLHRSFQNCKFDKLWHWHDWVFSQFLKLARQAAVYSASDTYWCFVNRFVFFSRNKPSC